MNPIHNAEAERQVLGSILIDPSLMGVIDLEVDDFYIHRNKFVWQAFLALAKAKSEIDFTTVSNELDKKGDVKIDYLYEITSDIPSALHAESYADIVREKAIRRKTVTDANNLVNLAHDETNDIAEKRANIAIELASTRGQSGAVHFNKWMSDGYERLGDLSHNPREHAGLSTGLGDLDKVFGDGPMPGCNLLTGDPGEGKTILAQQIALNWVEDDIPGAFYSGEMKWWNMYLRFMSSLSNQKVSDMMKGDIDFTSIVQAEEIMRDRCFFVDDPKGMFTSELRADLIRLKTEHNIQWMVFDYLGKLADGRGKMKDWERYDLIICSLQDMLVDLDITGLVIHQNIKSDMGKKPSMAGIAGGKDVTYEAVCAVKLVPHIPPKGEEPNANFRTVQNIKDQRLVEGGWEYCDLYKDPLYPRFGLAEKGDKDIDIHWSNGI